MREWIKRSRPNESVRCACGDVATWTLLNYTGAFDYCDAHYAQAERTFVPMKDSDLDDEDDTGRI